MDTNYNKLPSLENLDITKVIEPDQMMDIEKMCNDMIKQLNPSCVNLDLFYNALIKEGSLQKYLQNIPNQIKIVKPIQVEILISEEQMKSLFEQKNQVQSYKQILQLQLRDHLVKNQDLYVQIPPQIFELLKVCQTDHEKKGKKLSFQALFIKDLTIKILKRIIKTKANLINTFLNTQNTQVLQWKNQKQDPNIIHFVILQSHNSFIEKFLNQGTQIDIGKKQKQNKKYPYPAFKFNGKNQDLQQEYQKIVNNYGSQQIQIVIKYIKQNSSFSDFKYYNAKIYKDDVDIDQKMFCLFMRAILFLQTVIFWGTIFDQITIYSEKMNQDL